MFYQNLEVKKEVLEDKQSEITEPKPIRTKRYRATTREVEVRVNYVGEYVMGQSLFEKYRKLTKLKCYYPIILFSYLIGIVGNKVSEWLFLCVCPFVFHLYMIINPSILKRLLRSFDFWYLELSILGSNVAFVIIRNQPNIFIAVLNELGFAIIPLADAIYFPKSSHNFVIFCYLVIIFQVIFSQLQIYYGWGVDFHEVVYNLGIFQLSVLNSYSSLNLTKLILLTRILINYAKRPDCYVLLKSHIRLENETTVIPVAEKKEPTLSKNVEIHREKIMLNKSTNT